MSELVAETIGVLHIGFYASGVYPFVGVHVVKQLQLIRVVRNGISGGVTHFPFRGFLFNVFRA